MQRLSATPITLDLNTQCWLLAACCSLYPEEFASYPELRALRQAIVERHPETIAIAFEIACSHLGEQLSRRQRELALRLAQQVREGFPSLIRRTVLALSRASVQQRQRAS